MTPLPSTVAGDGTALDHRAAAARPTPGRQVRPAPRAGYLRPLALGLPPSRAELIPSTGDPGAWRGDDPAFAAACDAVSAASAPYGSLKPVRLTPERIAQFLAELRTPGPTVLATAIRASAL
ncbi:hypothetical protein [Streptomyces sp. NPDC001675]